MDKNKKIYVFIGAVVIIIIALISKPGDQPPKPSDIVKESENSVNKPEKSASPDILPGLQTGNAPWNAEIDRLKERLSAIGLSALLKEGSAVHTHQHLDIFVNGKPIDVPAEIGVNESAGFISPVHTHEHNAIIHVESPIVRDFTLGQFFDIWGVKFTDQCVGSYCVVGDKVLKVFVNGKLTEGNPRDIKLERRQEIVITYGTENELPNPIPATYAFPVNL